jgi:hypothetical protein
MKAGRFNPRGRGRKGYNRTTPSQARYCRSGVIPVAEQIRGLDTSKAMRPKELERENARLKKLPADRNLEIEVMKAKSWTCYGVNQACHPAF